MTRSLRKQTGEKVIQLTKIITTIAIAMARRMIVIMIIITYNSKTTPVSPFLLQIFNCYIICNGNGKKPI